MGRGLAAGALALLLGGCAADTKGDAQPRTALATSAEAQLEFRSLQQRWLAERDRSALEAPLAEFLMRHAGDPREALARVYLAWIYLDSGRLDRAEQVLEPVRRGAPGVAQDWAKVAQAAVLIRRGQSARAILLLEPLSGKIIDPDERLVFGEQFVMATLAARQWELAARAMLDWLAHAGPSQREHVQLALRDLLLPLPARALERCWVALSRTGVESPTRAPARQWLIERLRERLTRLALMESDAALARRLLESASPSVRASESGLALARVAAEGVAAPRRVSRAIGVVLSLGDEVSRRRSAELAAGVSRALGLPAAATDPESVRLVLHEDGGGAAGMQRALTALSSDGAAVLIAGVDPEGASAAAAYGQQHRVPVVLLHEVPGAQSPFTFTVAPAAARDQELLEAELVRRSASPDVLVGGPTLPCDAPAQAGQLRFPVERWRREKVAALVVVGGEGCARDLLGELRQLRYAPIVALGFESAVLAPEARYAGEIVSIASGQFPAVRADVGAAGLSWFGALGHDAAVLAATAVRTFPLQPVEQPAAVAQLHERARLALRAATGRLWSTAAAGFAGDTRLSRDLRVQSWGGAGGGSAP